MPLNPSSKNMCIMGAEPLSIRARKLRTLSNCLSASDDRKILSWQQSRFDSVQAAEFGLIWGALQLFRSGRCFHGRKPRLIIMSTMEEERNERKEEISAYTYRSQKTNYGPNSINLHHHNIFPRNNLSGLDLGMIKKQLPFDTNQST